MNSEHGIGNIELPKKSSKKSKLSSATIQRFKKFLLILFFILAVFLLLVYPGYITDWLTNAGYLFFN